MYDKEIGIDDKVHCTLRDHYDFWKESGASEFACSVIRNGYIPEFSSDPGCYSEPNNKLFSAHAQWGMEAVAKLVKAKIVRKVRKEDLTCINPLSVAVNSKSKNRLCIDLSRCYNKVSHARKFKIESTREALQIIERGDYMFSFDLKSAYLMIPVHKEFMRYLGFSVTESDGTVSYYCYLMLPFGLNDAARVLTKVMRSPVERWRKMGIIVFIHIDDGFSCCSSRQKAMWASQVVREDLIRYGLLISEGKCTWGARRSIEWTGFVFDTCKFQLTVPEPKLARAAKAVEDMLERRHGLVLTKELASVAGLLGSFNLAMGSVTRFHTRGMMTKLVEVTELWGWSGKLVWARGLWRSSGSGRRT